LWENALRRYEVSQLNISDFDSQGRLRILAKGWGTQHQWVGLAPGALEAIALWLSQRGKALPEAPLFVTVARARFGSRLSPSGIYHVVRAIAKRAGIEKLVSPHRIRHSSITAALDATDGNLREVQKLSRHSNLNTLVIYDDRRREDQRKVSSVLSDLL